MNIEILKNRVAPLKRHAGRSIRPLIRILDGRARSAGCCILMKVGDHRFLLSVAHVLDRARYRHLWLYREGGSSIPLDKGQLYSTTQPGRSGDDPLDMGLLDLDGGYPELEDQDFLGLPEVDQADRATEGVYTAIGFPSELDRRTEATTQLDVRWLTLQGDSRLSALEQIGFSSETHIAVEFDPTTIQSIGVPDARMPDPDGMSGGAFFGPNGTLAGLMAEHAPEEKLIIGPRITHYLGVMSEIHAELFDMLAEIPRRPYPLVKMKT